MKRGVDLKSAKNDPSDFSEGRDHECRQDTVCPVDGFSAVVDISSLCDAVRWRQGCPHDDLCGTVPGDGLCSTHLPGKSARHRGQSFCASRQVLSHGVSRTRQALDAGRRQRIARLAHLCRLRCPSDRPSENALCRRRLGAGIVEHGVCPRFDHHRSVSVGVSVGALSNHQGSGQDAHAARLAGQHSEFHPCLRRQVARRACPGFADSGSRCDLRYGSRVCRFCSSASIASGGRLLRHARQIESQGASGLFGTDRPQYRHPLRSDNCTRWLLLEAGLPRAVASGPSVSTTRKPEKHSSFSPIR